MCVPLKQLVLHEIFYISSLNLDASAEFVPINLMLALEVINNRLDNISINIDYHLDHFGNWLDNLSAITYNTRIVSHNAQRTAPQPYLPLQKLVCLLLSAPIIIQQLLLKMAR